MILHIGSHAGPNREMSEVLHRKARCSECSRSGDLMNAPLRCLSGTVKTWCGGGCAEGRESRESARILKGGGGTDGGCGRAGTFFAKVATIHCLQFTPNPATRRKSRKSSKTAAAFTVKVAAPRNTVALLSATAVSPKNKVALVRKTVASMKETGAWASNTLASISATVV